MEPPRRLDGTVPDWVQKRHDIVMKHCKSTGWDIDNLSIDQIIQIRALPEWKAAGTGILAVARVGARLLP